ncbi:MAG: TetR/AcrR family transcriptional regulator [Spirochaetaceae bacterium]|jgi:AcrR family transcriptional regulator|nr:TetR/AcrR family transcriptional regulator [Spirochaetaceae bacterium]
MTKQEIITAAFSVWGRDLYQSTSLEKLARALGVSKPALYRHFKNKQALLDAMYASFFDRYAAFIKPRYDTARALEDPGGGLLCVSRAMLEYYIRHKEMFVFSIVRHCGNERNIFDQFLERGIDLRRFQREDRQNTPEPYPSLIQLIMGVITFVIGYFHRPIADLPDRAAPVAPDAEDLIAFAEKIIAEGLGVARETVGELEYACLEGRIGERSYETGEGEALLKAVAKAVAEAGPYKASMDMVARCSGLSKSGLYSHFKNKKDMLRRLFVTEFDRIIHYAEEGGRLSEIPAERLYLTLFSVADYLRARSEILLSASWIKTRRFETLDLKTNPFPRLCRLYRAFQEIDLRLPETGENVFLSDRSERLCLMILFLIVHILTRRTEKDGASALSNESIRRLFRFIALGMRGL